MGSIILKLLIITTKGAVRSTSQPEKKVRKPLSLARGGLD